MGFGLSSEELVEEELPLVFLPPRAKIGQFRLKRDKQTSACVLGPQFVVQKRKRQCAEKSGELSDS